MWRKTAVVSLELGSGAEVVSLPLAVEREFNVALTIDNRWYPAHSFHSPINDEQWREFSRQLRACNDTNANGERPGQKGNRDAAAIRALARKLYQSLAQISPDLEAFLNAAGTPRRLVIQTTRPELHLLPWGGMVDEGGHFLAAGDLSVVHCWKDFNPQPIATGSRLRLLKVLGTDTRQRTRSALAALEDTPELEQFDITAVFGTVDVRGDILHVEAHGDAAQTKTGGVDPATLAANTHGTTLALLWSCYSAATDSWGESPALSLHRGGPASPDGDQAAAGQAAGQAGPGQTATAQAPLRKGATLVLSFLAELNYDDADSISATFYNDVFGPAASRDPESALLRIRAAKSANELGWANWASMTVFLRQPLDLSALPLNGPRLPGSAFFEAPEPAPPPPAGAATETPEAARPFAAQPAIPQSASVGPTAVESSASATDSAPSRSAPSPSAASAVLPQVDTLAAFWSEVGRQVARLQPGSKSRIEPPLPNPAGGGFAKINYERIPAAAFRAWRGNVVRISETLDALPDAETLALLGLTLPDGAEPAAPGASSIHVTDPADRLTWFFQQIARYGAPLIVWTDAADRHWNFLETAQVPSTLTFLLLYRNPPESTTLMELVDEHRLREALERSHCLCPPCSDNERAAAYWACVRGEKPEEALEHLRQLVDPQEKLLLMGNYASRSLSPPLPADIHEWIEGLPGVEQPTRPEDFYRLAMNPHIEDFHPSLRETGRARHELAYALYDHGQREIAEALMHQALREIEDSGRDPGVRKEARWYFALSATLRDLADLLAGEADRVNEAWTLLHRAMAIQSYHGMRLELAYSVSTAAKISLAACHFTKAVDRAVDAANLFELCENWRGWFGAILTLFDALAEANEAARMLRMCDMVEEKLMLSNLSENRRARNRRELSFQRARAHWIAGDLPEARRQFQELSESSDDKDPRVERLHNFLRLSPATSGLVSQ